MLRNKKAFTLVELLVVVAIVGTLATLSVIALNNARAKSRDTKRVADVRQMCTALEMFYNDKNRYPTTAEWASSTSIFSTSSGVTTTYLNVIPTSPTPKDGTCDTDENAYSYSSASDDTYTLSFCAGGPNGGLTAGGIYNAIPACAFIYGGAGSYDEHNIFFSKFDGVQGGTTFTDSSSNNYTITKTGTVTTDTSVKKYGTGSAHITAGSKLTIVGDTKFDFGTGPFTIDFWMKGSPTSLVDDSATMINFGNNYSAGFLWFYKFYSYLFVYPSSGAAYINCGTGSWPWYANTNWHHIAAVKTATAMGIYIDGVTVGYRNPDPSVYNFRSCAGCTANVGWIGDNFVEADYYVDNFRVTDYARWTGAGCTTVGQTCFTP